MVRQPGEPARRCATFVTWDWYGLQGAEGGQGRQDKHQAKQETKMWAVREVTANARVLQGARVAAAFAIPRM